MFNNKRGSISIAVMVIGTLFLFVAVLSMLALDSSRVSGDFDDAFWYGRVYANESSVENSLYFMLVESFLDNYQLVLKENSEKIGNEDIVVNKKFSLLVARDTIALVRTGGDGYWENFLGSKNILTLFDNKSVMFFYKDSVSIEDFRERNDIVLAKVKYSTNISVNVSFKQLGLLSFDDINKIYCQCLSSSGSDIAKKCFEDKFSGFDVSFEDIYSLESEDVSVKPVGVVAKLSSKEKYYIGKEMQKIEFNLIFDYFDEGKLSTNLAFCSSK